MTPAVIAGRPVSTTEAVDVCNPWDATIVGRVPLCGEAEVDAACQAAAAVLARDDFPQHARADVLDQAAAALRARRDDFAHLIVAEAGKPIRAARTEVGRCVDTLRFAAAAARTLVGEMVPTSASAAGEHVLGFALRVPIGVVAAITPFNFPLNLVAHKLAPAIAAGCPVVLKPAPQTPLTALALVDLLVGAGMPADYISVVTDGGAQAARPLVAHPVPRMISFTGSVSVGWQIAAAAPRKRVALELGSNAPVIVEADADLRLAVERIAAGAFGYAGQSCISVQRVLVHRSIQADFGARLAAAAAALRVGDPRDFSTDIGPVISAGEQERIRDWIQEACDAGTTVLAGGRSAGPCLAPTVVNDPPLDARIVREEVFGPVVSVLPYDDLGEAITLANDTTQPLQAGIFTTHLLTALRAVRQLEFGGVLVNDVPTSRLDQQPYGGNQDAGNTREGPAYAAEQMTELRFVGISA